MRFERRLEVGLEAIKRITNLEGDHLRRVQDVAAIIEGDDGCACRKIMVPENKKARAAP
jgi:hypothetical protein